MTDGPIMDDFDGDELDRILAARTIWPWREVGDDQHRVTLERLAAVGQYLYDTMNGDAASGDQRPPDPLPELAMEHVRAAQAAIDAAIKAGQRARPGCVGGELDLAERWESITNPKEDTDG